MRSKQADALPRFIPAHAGNSMSVKLAAKRQPAVHPRACGELMSDRYGVCSPRNRFIPAHAGNSGVRVIPFPPKIRGSSPRMRGTRLFAVFDPWLSRRDTVHPRACGELAMPGPCRVASAGSSPRMRGTPRQHAVRFIPAHAGNSICRVVKDAVHPRACGELAATRSKSDTVHPRACGELPGMLYAIAVPRPMTVHPRACGELSSRSPTVHHRAELPPMDYGSSPRMRGTQLQRSRMPRNSTSVHPRACGELFGDEALEPASGSSPRMRGTPLRSPSITRGNVVRFIPAHAGNSGRKPADVEQLRFIPAHAGNS